jgi:hypothetical protein
MADLALTVDGPAVAGQDLVATLVAPEPLEDVAVALVRTEGYRTKAEEVPTNGQPSTNSAGENLEDLLLMATAARSKNETQVDVVAQVELGAVGGISEIRIPVPATAEPTTGDVITWVLRAFRGGEAEIPVVVQTTRAQADAATFTGKGTQGELISLRVSGGVVAGVAGQRLTGAVVIEPQSGLKLTEVGILFYRSHSDDNGALGSVIVVEERVAGALELPAGARQELPFAVDVPADAWPSCDSAHNDVAYWIKVTAARRMRKDLAEFIRVYVAAAP